MNQRIAIIVLAVTVIACGYIFSGCRPAESIETDKPFLSREKAEAVVKELTDLGYYKYADPADIDSLKEDLVATIAEYGILYTLYFDGPLTPKDFRYYMFDGETVFEQGGFTSAIEEMKGTFDKTGLKLEITNHIEEWDSVKKALNHELTVNGKRYVIFKDFSGYGWGEAAQGFADMINDQMQLQHKDERLYLINAGNDGNAVFLTDAQFRLIDQVLTDDAWKPLKTEKWVRVFQVKE